MRLDGAAVDVGPGRRILGPISIEFAAGEWTTILGPNGAGKTTLCRAIVDGVKLSEGNIEGRTGPIGLLSQSPHRPIGLTALEYTLVGLSRWGGGAGDIVVAARDALEFCGVDPGQMVETLSGGEFRKAGIARLVTMSPDVMVLDEPSAGLDPQARIEMLELLEKVRADRILITVMHDLSTASQFGERFVVLDEGVVVADGRSIDVFRSEGFTNAFGHSIRLIESRWRSDARRRPMIAVTNEFLGTTSIADTIEWLHQSMSGD